MPPGLPQEATVKEGGVTFLGETRKHTVTSPRTAGDTFPSLPSRYAGIQGAGRTPRALLGPRRTQGGGVGVTCRVTS